MDFLCSHMSITTQSVFVGALAQVRFFSTVYDHLTYNARSKSFYVSCARLGVKYSTSRPLAP